MKSILSKLFAAFALLISACSPAADATKLTPVTFQLGSTHQAIYAGFYAADQNGDYMREGLDVTIIEGATNMDVVTPIVDGTAQFGILGASALISERAAGKPVRAIAAIIRRDPIVFFSLADSGITHLEDFVGKRVQVSQRLRSRFHAMLGRVDIDPSEIIEVSTGNFADLYTNEIDVASGLITSSVLSARQAGYDVNIIYPDDYGVHFYSTSLFTSDDHIAANPEVVTRFLRATLNGWAYAIENPLTIGEIVRKYNPDANSEFETSSMIASLPYIDTGEDHLGWMKSDVWEGMTRTMHNQGDLTTPIESNDVYTIEFIEQIYGGPNP